MPAGMEINALLGLVDSSIAYFFCDHPVHAASASQTLRYQYDAVLRFFMATHRQARCQRQHMVYLGRLVAPARNA